MGGQVKTSGRRRLTAAQIAVKPEAEPAVGERLYEPTNELTFGSPFVGYSGRYGDEVYHCRGGKCFVRRYVVPSPPATAKQIEQQARMQGVMPAWTTLPAEVRRAWLDYSVRHFGENQFGKKRGNLGQNLFTSAQSNRLSFGAAISGVAPEAPPPPRVIQVVEVPAPAGEMAWRVEHGMSQTAGCRLEVRMTPAAKGDNRPRQCRLVRAGSTTAGSFFPLNDSGTVYLLEQPVRVVAPGERYGLQLKLITAEGVEGRPLYVELTRKAPGALPSDGKMGSDELQGAVSAAAEVETSRAMRADVRPSHSIPAAERPRANRLRVGEPREPCLRL